MLKYRVSGIFLAVVVVIVAGYYFQGHFKGPIKSPVDNKQIAKVFTSFDDVLTLENFYSKNVQPIFSSKCVACHSCFNSPCQLDLTSYEGLMRGASPINVYDFPKLEAREPTRLFIDAHTTDDWREKGFFSVTSGGQRSVLHRLVSELPGIESGAQKKYDSEYSRICMEDFSEKSFEEFKQANPAGRMPFGFPGLDSREIRLLSLWYSQGFSGPETASMELAIAGHEEFSDFVQKWEVFLNSSGLKQKIVARYLYEHLFLAHLFFEDQPHVFFRLVRSKTRTGKIVELATALPFEDPGGEFYYRLRPVTYTMAHKTNIPFKLTDSKLEKWEKDFLEAEWPENPTQMPEYGLKGSNPFKTFSAIPASAKYQLFLENSTYFIMTFIKGPVCRGQTALNVINDHFWVLFLDPSRDVMVQNRSVYKKISSEIEFPSLIGDDFDPLVSFRKKYWESVRTKFAELEKGDPLNLNSIWKGRGVNNNAANTVFRHFDSATVLKGLRSHTPKTIWVLDYHVFESIYYNLSAGYNVFGPLLHQLNSRMFMEVSRVASEDLFLSFLPEQQRLTLRQTWNQPSPPDKESFVKQFVDFVTEGVREKLSQSYSFEGTKVKSAIRFTGHNSKEEFLELIRSKVLAKRQYSPESKERRYRHLIRELEALPVNVIQRLPEAIIVLMEGSQQLWTLIHNKAHYNIAMILFENERRNVQDDSLSVIEGVGTSYANLIFQIPEGAESEFISSIKSLENQMDVIKFYRRFAVSRKDPNFWNVYNKITDLTYQPLTGERGPLDLNRYIMW